MNPSGLNPQEFNIIVMLDEPKQSSIIIPDSVKEKDDMTAEEGELVAVSPMAFNFEGWPAEARKPQPGDRVMFARYSGIIHERGGRKFRIIKDKSLIAVIEPVALAAVA